MTTPAGAVDLDVAPPGPRPVVLALGSNVGDRAGTLADAVRDLSAAGLVDLRVSPVVETAAVGGPVQGDYLNAVVLAVTRLSPHRLLDAAQAVEATHGRRREVHWGPRTLDVDVVTYGDLVAVGPRLVLPHPLAHRRAFVLVPWLLADPGAVLPGPRGGRVADLAAVAADRAGLRPRADVDLAPFARSAR